MLRFENFDYFNYVTSTIVLNDLSNFQHKSLFCSTSLLYNFNCYLYNFVITSTIILNMHTNVIIKGNTSIMLYTKLKPL